MIIAGFVGEIEQLMILFRSSLQLLHGAKNGFLQERNSLKTLVSLEQLNILPPDEVGLLREAYIFLRTVEHRLQIQNEQQTHTLPVRQEAWPVVAISSRGRATGVMISSCRMTIGTTRAALPST